MDLLVTLFYDLFCKQKYTTIMQRPEIREKNKLINLGKFFFVPGGLSEGIDDAK